MRIMNFVSMRGTELCGSIVDQKRTIRGAYIFLVQKCGRLHAVVNGQALVDADLDADKSLVFKRCEGEI